MKTLKNSRFSHAHYLAGPLLGLSLLLTAGCNGDGATLDMSMTKEPDMGAACNSCGQVACVFNGQCVCPATIDGCGLAGHLWYLRVAHLAIKPRTVANTDWDLGGGKPDPYVVIANQTLDKHDDTLDTTWTNSFFNPFSTEELTKSVHIEIHDDDANEGGSYDSVDLTDHQFVAGEFIKGNVHIPTTGQALNLELELTLAR